MYSGKMIEINCIDLQNEWIRKVWGGRSGHNQMEGEQILAIVDFLLFKFVSSINNVLYL